MRKKCNSRYFSTSKNFLIYGQCCKAAQVMTVNTATMKEMKQHALTTQPHTHTHTHTHTSARVNLSGSFADQAGFVSSYGPASPSWV